MRQLNEHIHVEDSGLCGLDKYVQSKYLGGLQTSAELTFAGLDRVAKSCHAGKKDEGDDERELTRHFVNSVGSDFRGLRNY